MISEETPDTGLIIEQTDSGENHFVFRAMERRLDAIGEELAAIRSILLAGHTASEALRAEAQAVLEAHAQSAEEYVRQVEEPEPPDFDPFVAMPAGTTVRDLPDGGRLFTLADGSFVRVDAEGNLSALTADGAVEVLEPARGGVVTLPDGRELVLKPEAVRVTHEAAGIEGLPLDIDPVQTAEGRYRVELPGGYRLDVSHNDRTAVLGNPDGTVDILAITRIEGIGEKIEVRLVPGGAKGFAAAGSGHKGIIEADGTIHLSVANGLDLVVRFPESTGDDEESGPGGEPPVICEERDKSAGQPIWTAEGRPEGVRAKEGEHQR